MAWEQFSKPTTGRGNFGADWAKLPAINSPRIIPRYFSG